MPRLSQRLYFGAELSLFRKVKCFELSPPSSRGRALIHALHCAHIGNDVDFANTCNVEHFTIGDLCEMPQEPIRLPELHQYF